MCLEALDCQASQDLSLSVGNAEEQGNGRFGSDVESLKNALQKSCICSIAALIPQYPQRTGNSFSHIALWRGPAEAVSR